MSQRQCHRFWRLRTCSKRRNVQWPSLGRERSGRTPRGHCGGSRSVRRSPSSPFAAQAGHVGRAIGERGTISLDAGALALWAYDRLPATGPGRLLTTFTTPLGTLGAGLPFAMAAKLARPDEPSVALVGDGAFGFSAMELDTAARHGIDVKVVVGNDASWGIVRRQMELGFGRSVAATLADRRYDELARSLGCAGERVDDARELTGALERLMRTSGPALLDVKLDGG